MIQWKRYRLSMSSYFTICLLTLKVIVAWASVILIGHLIILHNKDRSKTEHNTLLILL